MYKKWIVAPTITVSSVLMSLMQWLVKVEGSGWLWPDSSGLLKKVYIGLYYHKNGPNSEFCSNPWTSNRAFHSGGVPPPAKILENPPPLKKEKNNREDNTYCLRTIGTILRTIDSIFFSDFVPPHRLPPNGKPWVKWITIVCVKPLFEPI